MRELSDQAWERVLARDPVAALRCGRQVDALPRGGPGELADELRGTRDAREFHEGVLAGGPLPLAILGAPT